MLYTVLFYNNFYFTVQFIQQKSKSGKYIEDPYVEKYMINYLQAISKENGKKFLESLDSHLLERKRQLEVLYAIRMAEGIENVCILSRFTV
jgi:uncharacterized protein YaaW (UPF0174 family)